MSNYKPSEEEIKEYIEFAYSIETSNEIALKISGSKTPWLLKDLEQLAKNFTLEEIATQTSNRIELNARVDVTKEYGNLDTSVKTIVNYGSTEPESIILACFKDQKVPLRKRRDKVIIRRGIALSVYLLPYLALATFNYYCFALLVVLFLFNGYPMFFVSKVAFLLTLVFSIIFWEIVSSVFSLLKMKFNRTVAKLSAWGILSTKSLLSREKFNDCCFSLESKCIRFSKLPYLYEAFEKLRNLGFKPKVRIRIDRRKKLMEIELTAQFTKELENSLKYDALNSNFNS
jgi:hypothetical protein